MYYILFMIIKWNEEKNILLKQKRGIGFDDILPYIENQKYQGILDNPNYPNQKMFIIEIDEYIHIVPFVEDSEGNYFLKTIYKSRKLNKEYNTGGIQ